MAVNEDVCLRGSISDSKQKQLVARTGLRLLCTISIECRYFNPFATAASFADILIWELRKKERSGVRGKDG